MILSVVKTPQGYNKLVNRMETGKRREPTTYFAVLRPKLRSRHDIPLLKILGPRLTDHLAGDDTVDAGFFLLAVQSGTRRPADDPTPPLFPPAKKDVVSWFV